jgi:3-oxoacyl-[acyl-carrier-protein] synthase II
VTGDGGAGIVLEDLDHATKRKAHIYAEYLGGSFDLEGWKVAFPNLSSSSYSDVMLRAIDKSNISKEEIDLLVPHGVGTTATDYYEAKAITDVFGKNVQRPFITALKPYIGHNLGSTTLLETAILLMGLESNIIPPTLNTKQTDERLDINIVNRFISIKLNIIMKIACGFAGYNGASIFRKL